MLCIAASIAQTAHAASDTCSVSKPVFTARGTLAKLKAKLARHQPVRILAIGSSSTEGWGATSKNFSYPTRLQADLAAEGNDVTVLNAGKGGETAIETVSRLEDMLERSSFDLVIWQVGTNDAVKGVDESRFRDLLQRGVSAAKGAGVDMILLDQQYFPSIPDLARYEQFVGAVEAVGEERKVSVFSRYRLMRQWNERSGDELKTMLSADSFHMSDKGYACLAEHVAQEIEAMAGSAAVAAARPVSQPVVEAVAR
jgi:lysophospholipase L1-like esterase